MVFVPKPGEGKKIKRSDGGRGLKVTMKAVVYTKYGPPGVGLGAYAEYICLHEEGGGAGNKTGQYDL